MPKKTITKKTVVKKKSAATKKKTTKKNTTAKKEVTRRVGRPSDYKEEYADQAYKLCLLGLTDKELADFFGVKEQTINNWKLKAPEFFESIKRGKEPSDAQVVEKLYKRANGYAYDEVDESYECYGDEPPILKEKKVRKKHMAPDTNAIRLWLTNRQPKKWRDKHDVEHSGHIHTLSDDELESRIKELSGDN